MLTIAFTKKYDWALSIAADDESPSLNIDWSMPVASSDCMRRSGRLVVLLKARAGVTHEGNLNVRDAKTPRTMETALYNNAHTSNSQRYGPNLTLQLLRVKGKTHSG